MSSPLAATTGDQNASAPGWRPPLHQQCFLFTIIKNQEPVVLIEQNEEAIARCKAHWEDLLYIQGDAADDGNLQAICRFASRVGVQRIAFLPYNPSTSAKYTWLERYSIPPSLTQQRSA